MTAWRHVQLVHSAAVINEDGVTRTIAEAEMDLPLNDLESFREQYGQDWEITVLDACPPNCTAQLAKEA